MGSLPVTAHRRLSTYRNRRLRRLDLVAYTLLSGLDGLRYLNKRLDILKNVCWTSGAVCMTRRKLFPD